VTASLETLDWHSFLTRQQLPAPSSRALDALRGMRILVTGAGGSIGAALALQLSALEPEQLILLEASESHLFALQAAFAEKTRAENATFVLGDVQDSALLEDIFTAHRPRLVFHAAAFKHVPLLEEQPLAAIANNIFGTHALVTAAAAYSARVVLLSTDKAVEPASVMGATKRVAEQIVLSAAGTALRLGNVLASRDSVAEAFATELAAVKPLIVTDPAACRYFLTINEAVGLLLAAAHESERPVLLAAALPAPHYIADLARFLQRTLAPHNNTPIEFSHLRSGDKESEKLWSPAEHARPAQAPGLFTIDSPQPAATELQARLASLLAALDERDLAAALAQLRALVPDYTPSARVCALAGRHATRVTP
jgi:FlaA1/EpsC-like NDP-sugar epimerase